ncbi:MAG: proton-conducting transporter membrane subunit [Kiritimatiellaeota bacterium]|nr:proton-conducting transporter membrane subunit [Kiritimatiellota bacterium]
MTLFLSALALLLCGAAAAPVLRRAPRWASAVGAGSAVLGALLGLAAAVRGLGAAAGADLRLAWTLPMGSFHVLLDRLSSFFLLPLFLLAGLCAVYGYGYFGQHARRRDGASWCFYNLLIVAMALIFTARDLVLFLMAWELMALTSFALVIHEREHDDVRHAGWVYLVASHISLALLLALFLLLGRSAGTTDFDGFTGVIQVGSGLADVLFVLAVLGFGAKAGFLTLHGWLPEAHPAAPSHVSALMSGVMIKTGIYGLVRLLTFLSGPPPLWWGWLLIAVGLGSGVLGVLLALAQHDLKRLLAYHSVENMGIILLGLGIGCLGLTTGRPLWTALGLAGGLLHVLNHALFKGLLFLGAGAVLHTTGLRNMDRLGGLLRRMRWTGLAFIVGASAISGLPPFNGFASEFLIYLASFQTLLSGDSAAVWPALAVIGGLALIGGLAAACFAKVVGIVLLGEPRTAEAGQAHEVSAWLVGPMLVLAALCLVLGLGAPWLVGPLTERMASEVAGWPAGHPLAAGIASLRTVTGLLVALLILTAVLAVVRHALLRKRRVSAAGTWDCGYLQPTARMQYTSSSFAEPLVSFFQPVLRTRVEGAAPHGLFPGPSARHTHTPDTPTEWLAAPLFRGVARLAWPMRRLQQGRVQWYVLYIAIMLLVLLVWKL